MNNFKYIYNPYQAQYYISNGCNVLKTGIHTKTNKIYWVFDWNETKEIYSKWVNRNKK